MTKAYLGLFLLGTVAIAGATEKSHRVLTPAQVYETSKRAVVKVLAYDQTGKLIDTGTGFIIDASGIVLTADHVVSPPPALGKPVYYPKIRVVFSGEKPMDAQPIRPPNLVESVVDDYALLRISAGVPGKRFPCLKLGQWSDAEVGTEVTSLGYGLDSPVPLLITAVVSAKIPITRPYSENGVRQTSNAIIFEGAAIPGSSGGPLISDQNGSVVGIVTERLVGLGPELERTRQQILATHGQGSVSIMGVDPNQTSLALINVLDRYLSNGMGAAVSVGYARRAWLSMSNPRR